MRYLAVIVAPLIACAAAGSAGAQTVEEFYRGKTVNVIVSTGAGGVFDLTARTLAKHMPKHIPGRPGMIVRNMPGGGHVQAANFMANQATKDGTYIAVVNNGVALHQVIDGRGVRYDARQFNWLGSGGLSNLMTLAWHTSGIKTIQDVMERELVTGATGVGSNGFIYPNAMNLLLGTKFKIVLGYATSPQIDIALERGEIAARSGFSLSGIMQEHPDWISGKKINLLVQTGGERDKDFPDVPLMQELAKTPDQREILTLIGSPVALGRPFFTTPEVPADRLAALRRAFEATMKDEEFLAEARQLVLDLRPMAAEAVAEIVNHTVNTRPELIAAAKSAIEVPGGAGPGGKSN